MRKRRLRFEGSAPLGCRDCLIRQSAFKFRAILNCRKKKSDAPPRWCDAYNEMSACAIGSNDVRKISELISPEVFILESNRIAWGEAAIQMRENFRGRFAGNAVQVGLCGIVRIVF